MRRRNPEIPFERYADDVIVHCKTEVEAKELRKSIGERFEQCKLELHAEKTKIVYCKDDKRRGTYSDEKFDFLGFTFRSRWAKSRWGRCFVNFSPAISNEATKSIRSTVRSWRLQRRSDKSLEDQARMYNASYGFLAYSTASSRADDRERILDAGFGYLATSMNRPDVVVWVLMTYGRCGEEKGRGR